jgi:gamma-secretase subunit APH-1
VTLFLISALFRGFTPLSPSIGPYVGLVLVAILIQSASRFLLWRFHKLSLRALEFVSGLEEHSGAELLPNDHFSLSLTHGLAHSIVHTLFFCISWLPLSLGDGTIYTATCPQMSYYLVCALTTLGFAGILTGGMVLAFEGMERQDLKRGALLPILLHVVGGVLTLINFSQGGCVVSVPLILVEGIFVSVFAGKVWWKCTDSRQQRLHGSDGVDNSMPDDGLLVVKAVEVLRLLVLLDLHVMEQEIFNCNMSSKTEDINSIYLTESYIHLQQQQKNVRMNNKLSFNKTLLSYFFFFIPASIAFNLSGNGGCE